MLLPVSVYPIPLFDLIAVPLSPPSFLFRCVAPSLFLSLPSYLGCLALIIWLPFLPYAYYMWLSLVCFAFVSWYSLLNPFLATMSFAGYFHARLFLSASLFWCNFLHHVTTAGFVGNQLIIRDRQQRVRFCVILLFCFHLSSPCHRGEPGMGSASLPCLGSQPTAMLIVSVYLIHLFPLIVVSFSFICVFLSLCAASVALALVFIPGLYSAAYRTAPLA